MKRLFAAALLMVIASCTEQATAPGDCPDFCPGGSIGTRDSTFRDIIHGDSAFSGYIQGYQSEAMTTADLVAVQSRAFFVTNEMFTRIAPVSGDTTTVPITADSVRLRLTIVRRDTAATHLRLKLYQVPVTSDSTSTFTSLEPYFNGAAVDSFNVSDILASPPVFDTATIRIWGDTIRTDSGGHILQRSRTDGSLTLYFHLDALQAPLVEADSGRLGYGIKVAADSLASVSLSTFEGTHTPQVQWFYHYTIPDTVSATPDSVASATRLVVPQFDSFVFDPPTPPVDSNLAVGGVPSARSLLRVAMPAFLHDSIDVVRATLILVPTAAVPGTRSDSFAVQVTPVLTDLGAKSPLSQVSAYFGTGVVHIASADTLHIELTDLVRNWALDTTMVTAVFISQVPEAALYSQIRFYSTRTPAFRPALRITYVTRFPFGEP